MIGRILQVWGRLKYLYRISPRVMIRRIFHKIIAPIYRREVCYVNLNTPKENNKVTDNKGTKCIVLKTPKSIQVWKNRISPLALFYKLESHLADDPESIVILATRPEFNGSGKTVIGYQMCQPNVFIAPGIKEKLPLNSLFIVHSEVFPEYRGQNVNRIIFSTTREFCRQNGLTKTLSVVSAHNQPSIEAIKKATGVRIIAKFESLSLFFGLYRFVTPIEEIKKAVEDHETESIRK